MPIVIDSPSVRVEGEWITWSTSVGPESLWFRTRAEFRDLLSETCDAPLLALLYPAMLKGEDIEVRGALSDFLLYNLAGPLQALLQVLNPALKRVRISSLGGSPPTRVPAVGCATGFSGGVDSFSAVYRHYLEEPVVGPKLTHLTIQDIWSADNFATFDLASPKVHPGYKRLLPVAERWQLPLVPITSNVGAFYRGLRFEDTHTLRNAVIGHLLGNGVGRFIYASGYPFSQQLFRQVSDIARADNAVLGLVGSDSVQFMAGDPDLSRLEKTARLTAVAETRDHLHVCASTWERNCSVCWKCRRTMLTLDVLGRLDDYRRVFDVDLFRADRRSWLDTVLGKGDPFIDDIATYARKAGLDLATSDTDWRNGKAVGRWPDRANRAAVMLKGAASVTDVGCGHMTLEPLLGNETRYVPVDIEARDGRTIAVDLNSRPLPNTGTKAASVLGVVEYLDDFASLACSLRQFRSVVMSYNVAEFRPKSIEDYSARFRNQFSSAQIEDLMSRQGFRISEREQINEREMLWRFDRRSPFGNLADRLMGAR